MKNKVLATVVAMAMLVPTTVFAANSGVTVEKIEDGALKELSTTGESYETPSNVTALDTDYGRSYRAENLKTLTIGKGVDKVGFSVFNPTYNDIRQLETVTMEDVEVIEEFAFAGQNSLKKVILSDELREIKGAAFQDTRGLESIKLPKNLEILGSQAFRCSGLKEITIPGKVKTIENDTFELNAYLSKVVIEDGVEEIKGGAFGNCPRLREIHIPASVKTIATGIFSKSSVLTTIVYAPKGSYAEQYCKDLGMKILNADSNINPTVPTNPTQPETPKNGEFRGFKPVENLVGTENKYFEFGRDYGAKGIKSGNYEVQIWGDNTKLDYVYTNNDYCIVETGYIVKIEGKYYLTNGMANGKLTDPKAKLDSRPDGLWQFDSLATPQEITVQPMPSGIFNKIKGQKFTKESPEFYAYYGYQFVRKNSSQGKYVTTEEYNPKYVIIKFDNNAQASNKPVTPPAVNVPKVVTAVPTNSKVVVNGKVVSFDAYNINGNNYFKLRDLAKVVSGSNKQFEVTWDGSKNAINLVSNKPYTVTGGELSKGDGQNKTGNLNTATIYKDGQVVQLIAYNIKGNNYFNLRDVARAFDIGVTWNGSTNTVGIDTSISYEE